MRLFLAILSLTIAARPATGQLEKLLEEFRSFSETPEQRQRLSEVPISLADETRIGRQIFEQSVAQLRGQGVTVTNRGRDAKYLRALTRELRPLMRNAKRYRSIEVWVVESETTDAHSFPGGWITLTSGLLDFADSEAAIVGVLAHELSHIDRGHQLELPRRLRLAEQTFTAGPAQAEDWLETGKLFAGYFARPFRPEQEVEADTDAVRWMVENGYDAFELARLFDKWQQRDGERAGMRPTFLRTHPLPAERRDAVREEMEQAVGKRGRAVSLYRGHENLKRRIPRREREFRE